MKQFTDEEERAITETAEMIYNFKIGNSLDNIKGTLESFVLAIRMKPPKELKDCVMGDRDFEREIKEAYSLQPMPEINYFICGLIARAQLNSSKLAAFIKGQIFDWIVAHQTGVLAGQDMATEAGQEIPGTVSCIQIPYLEFRELQKEVSK